MAHSASSKSSSTESSSDSLNKTGTSTSPFATTNSTASSSKCKQTTEHSTTSCAKIPTGCNGKESTRKFKRGSENGRSNKIQNSVHSCSSKSPNSGESSLNSQNSSKTKSSVWNKSILTSTSATSVESDNEAKAQVSLSQLKELIANVNEQLKKPHKSKGRVGNSKSKVNKRSASKRKQKGRKRSSKRNQKNRKASATTTTSYIGGTASANASNSSILSTKPNSNYKESISNLLRQSIVKHKYNDHESPPTTPSFSVATPPSEQTSVKQNGSRYVPSEMEKPPAKR